MILILVQILALTLILVLILFLIRTLTRILILISGSSLDPDSDPDLDLGTWRAVVKETSQGLGLSVSETLGCLKIQSGNSPREFCFRRPITRLRPLSIKRIKFSEGQMRKHCKEENAATVRISTATRGLCGNKWNALWLLLGTLLETFNMNSGKENTMRSAT